LISNVDLRYAYLTFNRKYFSNKLPKELPIKFSKRLIRQGKLGNTATLCDFPLWIEISPLIRFSGVLVRMTLLHEMCHVENPHPTGHGKWFNKRMLRLAKDGAFNGYW
jgi:hypothetical protein